MSYMALYRKWRPRTFEEVVEQESVVTILKNAVTQNRVAHAYLFSGTRGTGKTTLAKIFARAVNCLHPVDGNPCNECEICRGILNGTILDVSEIDAASNNGVDNIRELRESGGRGRVRWLRQSPLPECIRRPYGCGCSAPGPSSCLGRA